ncbi:MAG: hypothetical protein WDN45_05045 [Caulobacteraceae bacterium]
MKTALCAAAAVTLGFLAAGASSRHAGAAEDGPILPGYWESTSTDSFSNAAGKTERKCITARAINAYLTGPSNSHYTCRYDTRELDPRPRAHDRRVRRLQRHPRQGGGRRRTMGPRRSS